MDKEDCVEWTESGRSFIVTDMDAFGNVLLAYFRHQKYSSFQRQLNLYGFRKISKGPETGAYAHDHFLRGRPEELKFVRRSSPAERAAVQRSADGSCFRDADSESETEEVAAEASEGREGGGFDMPEYGRSVSSVSLEGGKLWRGISTGSFLECEDGSKSDDTKENCAGEPQPMFEVASAESVPFPLETSVDSTEKELKPRASMSAALFQNKPVACTTLSSVDVDDIALGATAPSPLVRLQSITDFTIETESTPAIEPLELLAPTPRSIDLPGPSRLARLTSNEWNVGEDVSQFTRDSLESVFTRQQSITLPPLSNTQPPEH